MNISIRDPHFALPMVGSTIHAKEKGAFMADQYIGDMSLNFMIIEEVIILCGLDVINVRK